MSPTTAFLYEIIRDSGAMGGEKLHLNPEVLHRLRLESLETRGPICLCHEFNPSGPAKRTFMGMEIVVDLEVIYAEVK